MSDSLPADAPAPRLCHVVKIPTFEGYGFNLHAEKSKPGQFIGKVDPNSPAEMAGMLEGDRIVEVNGVNIASENHRQVVERIKAVPDETKLLVVDSATDAWYRERKLVPRSTQKNVLYKRTPTTEQNGHATNQVVENGSVLHKSEPEATELPADAPVPRLCHLVKWTDFEGYGFNLHAEKDKSGQFVGKIDAGSPAEYAGLHEGDRIVEVNGVNIYSETHRQIVERIKLVPNETKLLVLDPESEKWYKSRSIVAKGTQANVLYIKNPELNPATQKAKKEEATTVVPVVVKEEVETEVTQEAGSKSEVTETSEKVEENSLPEEVPVVNAEERPEPPTYTEATATSEKVVENHPAIAAENVQNSTDEADAAPKDELPAKVDAPPAEPPKVDVPKVEPPRTEAPKEEPSKPSPRSGDLNLNMSASEMRQLLAQRKKHDPKKVPMDLKKKYELIEQM